jgi:hypothetical protein
MERLRQIEADVRAKRGLLPSTPTASVPVTPRPAEASSRYIEQLAEEHKALKQQWNTLAYDKDLAGLAGDRALAAELQQRMDERLHRMDEIVLEQQQYEFGRQVASLLACGKSPLQIIRERSKAREWRKVAALLQHSGDPEAQELAAKCLERSRTDSRSEIWADLHADLEREVLAWCDEAERASE